MIRALFTFAFAFFLTACASMSPTLLYEGPKKPADQIAVLTSSEAPATAALLKAAFGNTPGVRASTLHMVDGKPGPNSYGPYSQVYNSTWDWSLRVQILPGQHSLVVMPNHHRDLSTPKVQVDFTAVAGHEYLVTQILETSGLSYRWYAVLVDQTANTLLYPTSITWKPQ